VYIISNPFCNLNKIYDSGMVSRNWYDVKSAIEFLLNFNIVQSAKGSTVVYFVRRFLVGPQEMIHANHLNLINKIYQMINSDREDSKQSRRQQIITKFLGVYYQMNRVMEREYRKNRKTGKLLAESMKSRREGEVVNLLQGFQQFLSGNDNGPILSGLFQTHEELAAHLDSRLYDYQNYYKKLIQNAIPIAVVIQTLYELLYHTKTDASQKWDISMKQVSNRIRPYLKPDGTLDFAKIAREARIESGMGTLYSPSDESILIDLDAIKRAIKDARGKERKKLQEDAEMTFPGITLE
jgi:hypothetical protein